MRTIPPITPPIMAAVGLIVVEELAAEELDELPDGTLVEVLVGELFDVVEVGASESSCTK